MWLFLLAALQADPAPERPSLVRLADATPPIAAAEVGALVLVLRVNGTYEQGVVTEADAGHLVLDGKREITAGDMRSLVTLRPASLFVNPGDAVTIVLRDGRTLRGSVGQANEESISVQGDGREARVKWVAVATVQRETDLSAGVSIPDVAAAPTPTPAPIAVAAIPGADPSFAENGVLELGGAFEFDTGSVRQESDVSEASASGYGLAVQPFVGFFVGPVELLLLGTIRSTTTNFDDGGDAWTSRTGVEIGAAYFFRRPTFFVGPQVLLGGYSAGEESSDPSGIAFEYEERGTTLSGGLALRLPLGDSALLALAAGWYQERYEWEVTPGAAFGSKGSGIRSGFETTVGVSVWRTTR